MSNYRVVVDAPAVLTAEQWEAYCEQVPPYDGCPAAITSRGDADSEGETWDVSAETLRAALELASAEADRCGCRIIAYWDAKWVAVGHLDVAVNVYDARAAAQ